MTKFTGFHVDGIDWEIQQIVPADNWGAKYNEDGEFFVHRITVWALCRSIGKDGTVLQKIIGVSGAEGICDMYPAPDGNFTGYIYMGNVL